MQATVDRLTELSNSISYMGERIGFCSVKPGDLCAINRHDVPPNVVDRVMESVAAYWGIPVTDIARPILPVDPSRIEEDEESDE